MPDVLNPALMRALAGGAVLITANQRLARHLHQHYVLAQRAAGAAAWPTPDILPLSAWLERTWSECVDQSETVLPLLLSAHHTQLLWEDLIAGSRHARGLLDVAATAQQAQEAWTLCRQYRLGMAHFTGAHDDARAFAEWAVRYEQRLREEHWLDGASLPDRLAELFAQGIVRAPARLLLAGFHERTPQQEALLAALGAAGSAIETIVAPEREARARRVALADSDSELHAAARWARALLERGAADIGIVVRDLARVRDRIERIFHDTLAPSGDARGAFNLSLGRLLAQYPVVQAALTLLELGRGRIALDRLGGLLCSPFLGEAEAEAVARAHFDARLRESGQRELTLDALRAQLQSTRAGRACPALLARMQRAIAFGERRRRPSEWADVFSRWLSVFGWPGERTLDSDEYQTASAWRELLAQYRALDAVVARQSAADALATLRGMASRSVFQPRQDAAPIQILGVLEASGLRFAHLWLLGFADDAWPAPPRPHPFLPLALQRAHDLPHASAARELAFSRRVTAEVLASANEVVVSAPLAEGERHFLPSPLVAHIPACAVDELALAAVDDASAMQRTAAIETVIDEYGPAFGAQAAPGGASLFRHQAACPFRAFALTRLHARGLAEAQSGLDGAERGTVVHQVLFELWGRVGDQARLQALSEDEIDAAVRAAIAAALTAAAKDAPLRFPPVFMRLEAERLRELVHAWLVRERERAPFVVVEREVARAVAIEGLEVQTRADRVDLLADGSHLIIDYKTGSPREAAWFGERPDEPQLPLYAVTESRPLAGIAFAQLAPRELRWRGVARAEGIAPGIAPYRDHAATRESASWDAIVDGWRATLAQLAREYRAGYARVDPKEGAATCRHCDLAMLCRIHEHDGLGLADDDD